MAKSNKHKPWQKGLRIIIIISTLLVIAYGVVALITDRIARKKMSQFSVEHYVEQTPKFIFKTIHFYKYVAYGKPDGTNSFLDKLDIYHLSGYADLYIDMQYLKMDSSKTDYLTKELYLVFDSPTEIPIGVDINIPADKCINVETIKPKMISEAEATKTAQSVSVVTKDIGTFIGGFAGAYMGVELGGKVGNSVGNAIPNPIVKFASGLGGSILGGGIGAIAGSNYGGKIGKKMGFVITKNLLTGFHLTSGYGAGEKEQILVNAEALIAIELAGGDKLNEPDCENQLQKYYQKECKKAIETSMKNFGWQKVNVEFKYR